uniref:RGS domain-containing protein n=1 Tax=Cyprinodon variegatus TaxID=28743 RepID=A0A3Q2DYX0_CYPVA
VWKGYCNPPLSCLMSLKVILRIGTKVIKIFDKARSWAVSFERLMKSAAGRSCFRQFLRTEFSEENMMFWLACEELKKETNKTVVEEKVRQIYEDFISILSPKEVSLDSRVREVINRNMLEPTSHTFDDAQQQIYTLMQRDSYPRYINSSAYTDLLKSLEEPPPDLWLQCVCSIASCCRLTGTARATWSME